mgnify:CR=1 FL=1
MKTAAALRKKDTGYLDMLLRNSPAIAAGAIDGLVNNYLAIEMIFRPLEKKRYLGIFPYQGLFPARQT